MNKKPQDKNQNKKFVRRDDKKNDNKKYAPKNQKSAPKPKPKHLIKPDPISEKAFEKQCSILGLELNNEESVNLRNYMDTLMLWNTRINLVGTLEWQETFSELILDSFYLAKFLEELSLPENVETWDLGSGAGLPGIPLRIRWQKGNYRLVESREKRALFLTTFLLKNPLGSTKVFWGRAEKFFDEQKSKDIQADMIVSRAFMPYQELAEFVYPHVKKGGILLLMLNEAMPICPDLWEVVDSTEYNVKHPNGKSSSLSRYFHALRKI